MARSTTAPQTAGHRLAAAIEEFSAVAGIVNAGYGRLVDLAVVSMADRHDVGPGLHTPGQYIAWQAGTSKATANQIVRIAKRAEELPHLHAALRAGEISLDQADAIASLCPAKYDQAATELAKVADVAQLRTVLRDYRDPDDPSDDTDRPTQPHGISVRRGRHGDTTITAHVTDATADAFERALQAMTDDLVRQRQRDAATSQGDGDGEPAGVEFPTSEDALAALCETALRAGEAAHPGTDRYLLGFHVHASSDGRIAMTDRHGRPVADALRRQLLCDWVGEAILHDPDGTAISVGRKTRNIGPKLRRAILFRDQHRCTVPGCDTTRGLQIHHLVHWEDGGRTDTANLLTLCGRHHRLHHRGHLLIAGNADLATGAPGAVSFATPERGPIPDRIAPEPLRGPRTQRTLDRLHQHLDRRFAHRHHPAPGPIASTPTGERLDRSAVHLTPNQPDTPPPRTTWTPRPCTYATPTTAPPPTHHRPLRT